MFLKGKSPERISGIDNEIVSVLRFFFCFFFCFSHYNGTIRYKLSQDVIPIIGADVVSVLLKITF